MTGYDGLLKPRLRQAESYLTISHLNVPQHVRYLNIFFFKREPFAVTVAQANLISFIRRAVKSNVRLCVEGSNVISSMILMLTLNITKYVNKIAFY